MAILKDPLFSDEARGQVSKVAIFKRAEVHPVFCGFFYHPVRWSAAKIAQANAWKALCNQWRALPESEQSRWRDEAPGVLTGFNYFMQSKGLQFYDGYAFGWEPSGSTWVKLLATSEGKIVVKV